MKGQMVHFQSLIWPVLFFIGGIITAHYRVLDKPLLVGIVFVFFLIVLGIWMMKNSYSYGLVLSYNIALGLFFGMGWTLTQFQQKEFQRYSSVLTSDHSPCGIISSITHYNKMDRIQVRIPAPHWWSPWHYFNVNLMDKNHDFHKGQIISLSKSLSRITSSSLPYTFPAREYWAQQNTSHEVFLRNASEIHVKMEYPESYLSVLQANIRSRIDKSFPNTTQAGIIKALILGQKEYVSEENKKNFKKAGLMHILAVSGLHVGIISALLLVLFFPIRLVFTNSWLHFTFLIGGLWMYAALTGMNTPVVRATILVTFYLTAGRIDRQIDKWNIYFWAVLLVLVIHPVAIFTISFQLSFGAVASILLFYNYFHNWVIPILGRNYFSGLVAVSLAAQIGILPMLLIHFQEVSLMSTLSSFLVIPLLFPLILFSAITLIIPTSWEWLSAAFINISRAILDIITGISNVLASWDISSHILVWSSGTLIILFLVLLIAGMYLEFRSHIKVRYLTQGIMGCILLATICEGVNIYSKRNQAVLVVYSHDDGPETELFYHGVCYTTSEDQPPLHILKSRKEFYCKKIVEVTNNSGWKQLLASIELSLPGSGFQTNNYMNVFDYVKDRHYYLDFIPETRGDLLNSSNHIIRVLYNQ